MGDPNGVPHCAYESLWGNYLVVRKHGSERRNGRPVHSHLDAHRAQDHRNLEIDGDLRQRANVQFNDPSILLEYDIEHMVLIVDEQERAIGCIPGERELQFRGRSF